MLLPFARFSTPGEAPRQYSGERAVNMCARRATGLTEIALMARSGLVEFADAGYHVRAMQAMGGDMYLVAGGKLLKATGSSLSEIGSVPNGTTYMAASSTQLALVAGGQYFHFDGTTFGQYTPGVIDEPVAVEFMDGYFVVIGRDQNRSDAIQVSEENDGATFDATKFSYAQEAPDALVGVLRSGGQLYMFGSETVQVFYNDGTTGFPFAPNRGNILEHGCINGKTIAPADSGFFWVRPDGTVMRSSGAAPVAISTAEVKEALSKATVTGGITFSDRGGEFYAVSRQGQTSLVYDMTTQLWHERTSGLEYDTWQPRERLTVDGVEYLGCLNGKIATASDTTYTDFGDPLLREAVSTPVMRPQVAMLEIMARGGVADIGRDPQVMLQKSVDGANTWGNEMWRSLGPVGNYARRAVWHSLGASRASTGNQLQFRIRCTDPVPFDIYGAKVA